MVPDIKDTWYFYSFAKQPTYIDGTTQKMIEVLTKRPDIQQSSEHRKCELSPVCQKAKETRQSGQPRRVLEPAGSCLPSPPVGATWVAI